MKKMLSLCLIACLSINTALPADQVPDGWNKVGGATDDYEVGIDTNEYFSPPRSYYIRSIVPDPTEKDINTRLIQTIDASYYRGQRLRMTAYVKSEHLNNQVRTWFYIMGDIDQEHIYKWVSKEKGWYQIQFVFDVNQDADDFIYGLSLNGNGILWVDDITMEVVDKSVRLDPQPKRSKPTNLP